MHKVSTMNASNSSIEHYNNTVCIDQMANCTDLLKQREQELTNIHTISLAILVLFLLIVAMCVAKAS